MDSRTSPELAALALSGALGLTRTAADVLVARGHREPALTRAFLEPRLADLTAPDAMLDREIAAERLAAICRSAGRVVVFGDYDVDGITAAAIMTTGLRALGAEVVPLLASRFDGGYGFSAPALARALDARPAVIVTCDCGSSDHPRIADAARAGVDVVVIDHHLVPDEPLPAHAFLNPHRPGCGFPFKHLASCGLAMTVVAAVRAKLGVALDLRPMLDLVALGTIADVAPLVGDNRALVRAGLARLATQPRPGLEALGAKAGMPAGAGIAGEDVAFRFAPRLNAPGRLGSPDLTLELLLERDLTRARALAARIEEACDARKAIERSVTERAIAQVLASGQQAAPAIVVGDEDWHFGVVGIVAARLVDRFGVPAIVVSFDGASGRGSARGPSGARLHDALTASRDALVGFGGHQAAAGVHLRRDQLGDLRDAFAAAVAALPATRAAAMGAAFDAVLHPDDDPAAVIVDFERLEPCGEGNPTPVVALTGAEVLDVRVMKQEHLRLRLRHERRVIEAFGFGLAAQAPALGRRIDARAGLRRDHYRGRGAVELKLLGLSTRDAG